MDKLNRFIKRNSLTLTVVLGLTTLATFAHTFMSSAYDVKVMAEQNRGMTIENRSQISKNYEEFRAYQIKQQVFRDSLNSFRKELQLTRKTNQQLYESVESLRRELIRKGIER